MTSALSFTVHAADVAEGEGHQAGLDEVGVGLGDLLPERHVDHAAQDSSLTVENTFAYTRLRPPDTGFAWDLLGGVTRWHSTDSRSGS